MNRSYHVSRSFLIHLKKVLSFVIYGAVFLNRQIVEMYNYVLCELLARDTPGLIILYC